MTCYPDLCDLITSTGHLHAAQPHHTIQGPGQSVCGLSFLLRVPFRWAGVPLEAPRSGSSSGHLPPPAVAPAQRPGPAPTPRCRRGSQGQPGGPSSRGRLRPRSPCRAGRCCCWGPRTEQGRLHLGQRPAAARQAGRSFGRWVHGTEGGEKRGVGRGQGGQSQIRRSEKERGGVCPHLHCASITVKRARTKILPARPRLQNPAPRLSQPTSHGS